MKNDSIFVNYLHEDCKLQAYRFDAENKDELEFESSATFEWPQYLGTVSSVVISFGPRKGRQRVGVGVISTKYSSLSGIMAGISVQQKKVMEKSITKVGSSYITLRIPLENAGVDNLLRLEITDRFIRERKDVGSANMKQCQLLFKPEYPGNCVVGDLHIVTEFDNVYDQYQTQLGANF